MEVVGNTLSVWLQEGNVEISIKGLTLYGHPVLKSDVFQRSIRQSTFGMYVLTGRPVSNSSRGARVLATSIPLTSMRTCRDDGKISMR